MSGTSGHGVGYFVDSSNEGRPGFIMLDLGTGESWRRLSEDPSVLRVNQNVPSYLRRPFYFDQLGMPVGYQQEGLDGIQITPDGKTIYYSPLTSTYLYSVPTVNLRARDSDPLAELAAHSNISHHGQRGADANGFEGDNQGRIYQLMPTENGVFYYDPRDLQTHDSLATLEYCGPTAQVLASMVTSMSTSISSSSSQTGILVSMGDSTLAQSFV